MGKRCSLFFKARKPNVRPEPAREATVSRAQDHGATGPSMATGTFDHEILLLQGAGAPGDTGRRARRTFAAPGPITTGSVRVPVPRA